MQKITPCLWFNFNAEEAVRHYLGIFRNGRIVRTLHYGDAQPELNGRVLLIEFEMEGQLFQALNGGPQFPFTEAVSLSVDCETQADVDALWARLTDGGTPSQCGWLKDRFGVSWQIVPAELTRLQSDPDPQVAARVTQAMLAMRKIIVADIEAAAKG